MFAWEKTGMSSDVEALWTWDLGYIRNLIFRWVEASTSPNILFFLRGPCKQWTPASSPPSMVFNTKRIAPTTPNHEAGAAFLQCRRKFAEPAGAIRAVGAILLPSQQQPLQLLLQPFCVDGQCTSRTRSPHEAQPHTKPSRTRDPCTEDLGPRITRT